jgi:hypothetical protein
VRTGLALSLQKVPEKTRKIVVTKQHPEFFILKKFGSYSTFANFEVKRARNGLKNENATFIKVSQN